MDNLHEIYDRSIFNRFFQKDDPRVLAWAENVLNKICSPGILPVFFDKENEDFKSFWGTFTHLFALVVIYARQYNEIDVNKILFELFIEGRGLITDTVTSEDQMYYLFYNYVKEYEKRGRLDIISTEGEILGELLRLIRYKNFNEFIFALLSPKEIGWTIGYSSPLWRRTDTVLNITKGYEKTVSVKDLTKYPLVNTTGIRLIDQVENGETFTTMSFVGNTNVGISSEIDKSKLLQVNPNIDYQFSFKIKAITSGDTGLYFGIQAFDENKRLLDCNEAFGDAVSNSFVAENKTLTLLNSDTFYEVRGLIMNKNVTLSENIPLNFLNGRALRFNSKTKYIGLILTQDRSINNSVIYIYDIKVKPLNLPFLQGCIGEKNVIASYYENNSYRSVNEIDLFIDQYLISYKNIFKATTLKEFLQRKVVFKVFSERKKYLNEAIVTINGKEYLTDQNGEIQIMLYPGDYLYSVKKTNYQTITDREIIVTGNEEVQVEYILLNSELYKRKVTFFVVNEQNYPLQGVEVIFNGESVITGLDGIAVFEAYPDITPYLYSIYKEGYYVIDKSVLVLDDIVVDETLVFIPVYTVTFNIKDPDSQPVKAANVTFNDVIKQTNENGQVIFSGITEGTYNYSVVKTEYVTIGDKIYVNENKELDLVFNPTPDYDVTFVIYAVDMLGVSTPLQGAEVSFAGITLMTNGEGTVNFSVKAGTYSLRIHKENYKTIDISNYIVSDNITETFSLKENVYDVTFVVLGENNTPISDATITIKGGIIEDSLVLTTNENGEVTVELSKANNYHYIVSATEYVSSEDIYFQVVNQNQTITVTLNQTLYNLTFIVKDDDNLVLQGAVVNVTGYGNKTTDSKGQAIFNVPRNTDGYYWEVTKTYYQNDSGVIKIYSQSETVYPLLKRKVGSLTIYVKDQETSSNISGAQVVVGSNLSTTGAAGSAIFNNLDVGETYNYQVSKESYSDDSGSVIINEGVNEITSYISNKTITVIFTVVNDLNTAVSGATVVFNNITKTTDNKGQVTYTNVKSGSGTSYSYRVSAEGFSSAEGTLSGLLENTSRTITLNTNITTANINVYKDNQSYTGATIIWTSYYSNGTAYRSSSDSVVTGPSTGYYSYIVTVSGCISKSGTTNTLTSVTVNLYTAFIVSFNSSSYAEGGMSSSGTYTIQYASDGYYDRLMETTSTYMTFSLSNTAYVKKIKQWPVAWSLSSTNGFNGCSNLISIVSGSPTIISSIASWFYNCSSLTSIPSGLFLNVSGSDATNCFRGCSSLTSVPSNLFSRNITTFENCFRDCTGLTSISGTPFNSTTGNLDAAFRNTRLTSVAINTVFGGFTTMSLGYTFADNPNLKTVTGVFGSAKVNTCLGIFSGCTGLNSVTAQLFRNLQQGSDSTLIMQDAFYNCSSLTSVPSNLFSLRTTSMVGCFKYSGVQDIEGARIDSGTITSWSSAFEGTPVKVVPKKFFYYNTGCLYYNSTFRDCTSLIGFNCDTLSSGSQNIVAIDLFPENAKIKQMEHMFRGCTSLVGAVSNNSAIGIFRMYWRGSWWQSLSSINYMFYGCSALKQIFQVTKGSGYYYPWNSVLSWPSTHSKTFYNCTNLIDYSDVPSGWK